MRLLISTICYLAGAAFCLRALFLYPRLGKERAVPPPGSKPAWSGWMAGEFTDHGHRIRQKINLSLVVGWLLLLAGLVIGRQD